MYLLSNDKKWVLQTQSYFISHHTSAQTQREREREREGERESERDKESFGTNEYLVPT
jgi:hypothetical protein